MEELGALFTAIIITVGIVFAICAGLCKIESTIDNANWNGGYHQCGGKWVYEQAVGHRASTDYLYKCDKCGMIEEFDEYRNN